MKPAPLSVYIGPAHRALPGSPVGQSNPDYENRDSSVLSKLFPFTEVIILLLHSILINYYFVLYNSIMTGGYISYCWQGATFFIFPKATKGLNQALQGL